MWYISIIMLFLFYKWETKKKKRLILVQLSLSSVNPSGDALEDSANPYIIYNVYLFLFILDLIIWTQNYYKKFCYNKFQTYVI